MLAPFYWIMALARIIQGVSSTFVWTVGLALLCDTTPEVRVGQQLGLAMAGLSAGVVLAPPIGGALYQRLGFNAPFIFSIGIVLVDLAGRLLVVERKNALPWGVDPAAITLTHAVDSDQTHIGQGDDSDALDKNSLTPPTPNEAPRRADPVVLAGLDGKLVVVEGRHSDIALNGFHTADTRTSSSEHHDEISAVESIPPTAKALEDSSLSPAVWNARNESLKGRIDDPGAKAQCTVQTPAIQAMQGGGIEKVERAIIPELNSDPLASGGKSDKDPQLTSMQVLSAMCHSRRALAAFTNTLIYG